MGNKGSNDRPGKWSQDRPHEEFLELCALSTTADLTFEEKKWLRDHLTGCADCRQALNDFEAAVDFGMPLLHSRLTTGESLEEETSVAKEAYATPTCAEPPWHAFLKEQEDSDHGGGINVTTRNGRRKMQTNWNYVSITFAAAIVLTVAIGIYAYQFGTYKGQDTVGAMSRTANASVQALQQQLSDPGHERQILLGELAGRDRLVTDLRHRIEEQSAALSEIRSLEVDLKNSLQGAEAEKQRMAEERATLSQRLDAAQEALQSTQAELDSVAQDRDQDRLHSESLETEIKDLKTELTQREQAMSEDEQLLAHDLDIRELMGARELYIAEVYDVAGTGQTNRPYGRVFYTKGKSLIFYAYDLDQQPGLKNASTFQVWGQRSPDREHAFNLGIFYEDSAAKRRWMLKFDDSVMLEQIDAVFVTVEPKGGSREPSGKRLLFASLRQEPNHP